LADERIRFRQERIGPARGQHGGRGRPGAHQALRRHTRLQQGGLGGREFGIGPDDEAHRAGKGMAPEERAFTVAAQGGSRRVFSRRPAPGAYS